MKWIVGLGSLGAALPTAGWAAGAARFQSVQPDRRSFANFASLADGAGFHAIQPRV